MDPNVILNRLVRLLRLDTTVFDEVRDDANELVPALVVAGVSSLLAGLGATLFFVVLWHESYRPDGVWFNTFILGGAFMAALYLAWIFIAYVVIVQVYKASADLQSLLRTMGYAAVPLAGALLMFIPVVWPLFAILPIVLTFVLAIYAVQAVTNADSTQVVMANVAGLAVFVLVLSIIAFSSDTSRIGAGLFAALFEPVK